MVRLSLSAHLLGALVIATCGLVAATTFAEPPAQPAANGQDSRKIVYLHGGRDSVVQFGNRKYRGLLARELCRQAFLIAARDELYCVTHDLHLGQALPKEGGIELDVLAIAGTPSRLEVLTGAPPMQKFLASEILETEDAVDLPWLVSEMEKRSRGTFVEHLRSAGVQGQPRPWSDKAIVSDETYLLLTEMSFVPQFRAACALHAEINAQGPSPNTVAALARAYSNLGVLTEYHWSAAHKVFAARVALRSTTFCQ